MRYLYRSIIIFLLIIIGCSVSKQPIILKSTNNTLYDFNKLKSNCLVLIYSYECGYSLNGLSKYNKLKQELSNIEGLSFVAFAEQSLENSIKNYPENSNVRNNDLNWSIFVGYDSIYQKLWKEEVFPEFIYFKNGKRLKTLTAPYDNELIKLKQYILDKNKTTKE